MTSSNLSCNPRCLKEVMLATSLGYKVSLLAFEMNNWSAEEEKKLVQKFPALQAVYIQTGKNDFFYWIMSSMAVAMSKIRRVFSKNNMEVNSHAFDRRSWLAGKFLQKNKEMPDLVIAHNPPVFYPAYKFAKEKNIPFGIDVEDFHAGETNDTSQQQLVGSIMRTIFAEAAYLSYASPLIKEYSEQLIQRNNGKDIVVNNAFPSEEFHLNTHVDSNKLQLVWFSQHIGPNRGLEKFLPLLDNFANDIELTLIGQLNPLYHDEFLKQRSYIHVLPPAGNVELNNIIGNYDIGLALEDPQSNLNRDICLTNKIFVYRQAGLYILATNTRAQATFIANNKNAGEIILEAGFNDALTRLILEKENIRQQKTERYQTAAPLSWDHESKKLEKTWATILN